MTEVLTQKQARKLLLHSQFLKKPKGNTLDVTLAAIEHLGYIQIDTISVVERAHHHTLWNRNPRYRPEQLDELVINKKVFEYWSHAAAYLPMQDYRFTLLRKQALKLGEQKHWYSPDKKMLRHVLERITNDGPLQVKDFSYSGSKLKEWQSKPAKQALEYLFMQGDLMVSHRHNFQKVYDLTERVLPSEVDLSTPTKKEYARFLIKSFLRSNGLAKPEECGYLRNHMKPLLHATMQEMVNEEEVVEVVFNHRKYCVLPRSLDLLRKPLSLKKLRILSPFDNLVIQRKRMQYFFDFVYRIECYVPKSKRVHGYFVLPVLWRGRLAARIDIKANRKTQTLQVLSLHLEKWVSDSDAFGEALDSELQRFMIFNSCTAIERCDAVEVSVGVPTQ